MNRAIWHFFELPYLLVCTFWPKPWHFLRSEDLASLSKTTFPRRQPATNNNCDHFLTWHGGYVERAAAFEIFLPCFESSMQMSLLPWFELVDLWLLRPLLLPAKVAAAAAPEVGGGRGAAGPSAAEAVAASEGGVLIFFNTE